MKYLLLALPTLSLALAQPTGFSVWTEPTPQVQGGQVCGTVKDASGNAVEYATVLLAEGGLIKNGAQTDTEGHYSMYHPVLPGTYTLTVRYLSDTYTCENLLVKNEMTVCVDLDMPRIEVEYSEAPIDTSAEPIFISEFRPFPSMGHYRVKRPMLVPMTAGCQLSLLDARRPYVSPLPSGISRGRIRIRSSFPYAPEIICLPYFPPIDLWEMGTHWDLFWRITD